MSDESINENDKEYGFAATRRIVEYLKENQIEFDSHVDEHVSVVRVPYSTDFMGNFEVFLFSSDDDNDVAVRNTRYIKAVAITPLLLAAINECNNRFRFVKFVLSEKTLWIGLEMDMLITTEDPGPAALECCRHMVHIGDEAYPFLQRAIWSDLDSSDEKDEDAKKATKALDDDVFSNLLQKLAEHANFDDNDDNSDDDSSDNGSFDKHTENDGTEDNGNTSTGQVED